MDRSGGIRVRSILRSGFARLGVLGLTAGLLVPCAIPAAAADAVVLRIGTTDDLDSLNPFRTALPVGYEVFTLSYDMLVGFGPDDESVPGYAESWSQSSDGLTWTFKIRSGMKWSDGNPATAEDAAWTLQYYLDAQKAETSLGAGYLDPYVTNAAITAATATDPTTLTVTTSRKNDRILQMYLPILPKHVWEDVAIDKVGDFTNPPPVVGTGPYQVVEWTNGQSARLVRNESYWGEKGAADEIAFQFFPDATNAMVEAFKNGELDYIRNPRGLLFDQLKALPGVVAINAAGNGFTQINFNCYAEDIPDGGASTKAFRDPAFRAALGYAIDREALITRVLNGFGTPGTTQVPAGQLSWHAEPKKVRPFDLTMAAQKLEEAGYPLRDGVRYDKEGQALDLSLLFPDNDPSFPKVAQLVTGWFGRIGIQVTPRSADPGSVGTVEYLDRSIPINGQLKYDMVIWDWVGEPDPDSLLEILTTDAIGESSDSQWSNSEYDTLYAQQKKAATTEQRKGSMIQMQQLFYDQAPYQILYYDDELHAYHTDKFSNWQTQPTSGGTPFFVNGSINYKTLKLASEVSPSASASAGVDASASAAAAGSAGPSTSATRAPSGSGGATGSTGDSTLLLMGVALVLVGVGAAIGVSRRRRTAVEDE
jgi:peptide/nickel transport system substrate-binding protein